MITLLYQYIKVWILKFIITVFYNNKKFGILKIYLWLNMYRQFFNNKYTAILISFAIGTCNIITDPENVILPCKLFVVTT